MRVMEPKRFGEHANAFGFLRLLLASLVIVSHTPELVDGDRHREVLTRLFGSLSFGEFAVDGFFVVSGFLITGSVLKSATPWSYLRKRVARIYPAFIIMALLCIAVVGPLGGGRPEHGVLSTIAGTTMRALILCPPVLYGSFDGMPYAHLNGAAWTLQYEFLCYVMILVAKWAGLLRSARRVTIAAAICLVAGAILQMALPDPHVRLPYSLWVFQGPAADLPRLIGLFLSGGAFYLAQGRVPLRAGWAAAALVGLLVTLAIPPAATIGFATFGAYVILFVAGWRSKGWLTEINNRNDISYGLYLYAWPIEKLLLWWRVSDSLLVLGLLTWSLAAVAGTLSWFLVEDPAMKLVRSLGRGFGGRGRSGPGRTALANGVG